jgi:Mn2+/Fe2+ NRAMP family transporter
MACVVLQEASARITIASGLTMGEALDRKFGQRLGTWMRWLTGGVVIMGCAAYEAGNILGAVAGLRLLTGANAQLLTAAVGAVAALVLWKGNTSWMFNLMMALVVVMGVAFVHAAFQQPFSFPQVISAAITPRIPDGSDLLVLGLVGTTIVPYNLFLASGISKNQSVPVMRVGLTISVVLGGLITAAILVAGTAISDFSSFSSLFTDVAARSGNLVALAIATGLFAAGMSSTITAPYASSIIAGTVLGLPESSRAVRLVVLGIGVMVGILGLQPIPVILLVQALNGLILPLLAVFLLWMINDPSLVSPGFQHHGAYNLVLVAVIGTVLIISLTSVVKAVTAGMGLPPESYSTAVIIATALLTTAVILPLFRQRRLRH